MLLSPSPSLFFFCTLSLFILPVVPQLHKCLMPTASLFSHLRGASGRVRRRTLPRRRSVHCVLRCGMLLFTVFCHFSSRVYICIQCLVSMFCQLAFSPLSKEGNGRELAPLLCCSFSFFLCLFCNAELLLRYCSQSSEGPQDRFPLALGPSLSRQCIE